MIEEKNLVDGLKQSLTQYTNMQKFGLDTLKPIAAGQSFAKVDELIAPYDQAKRLEIMDRALNKARNIKNFTDVTAKQLHYKEKEHTSYTIEMFRKFTLSVACIVLFFIGAPLGSIIRKGGLGWPLFYSVLFFILYHVTSITGEKLTENEVLTPFGGMWLSTFILLPIGLFLTMKAANDSKLFSFDYYMKAFKRRATGGKTKIA